MVDFSHRSRVEELYYSSLYHLVATPTHMVDAHRTLLLLLYPRQRRSLRLRMDVLYLVYS